MSDPENFLTRWSRRKQDVAKEDARQDAKPDEVKAPDVIAKADAAAPAAPVAAEPLDLSKLPSLDNITAETDVTAFLRPGVPTGLARAALRRAWSSDPAVREFVGLQENDWVFNPPGAAEGFGPLDPEHDVRKLLAQVFGETAKEEKEDKEEKSAAATEDSTPAGQIAGAEQIAGADVDRRSEPTTIQTIPKSDEPVVVQRSNNTDSNSRDEISTRRSHGGALPRPVSQT
jgi:hypothetical protein